MKFTIRVTTNSRATSVEKLDDASYKVTVVAPPEKGKANIAVAAALAEHFGVPRTHVSILAGHTAHTKIVDVLF